MCASQQSWVGYEPPAFPVLGPAVEAEKWFAVHTRSRHEKVVAQEVHDLGLTAFLPLVKEERRWSDRKKIIESPLFSCYVFVRIVPTNEERVRVLQVNGVLGFVGIHGGGDPIPEEQIHAVRTVVEGQLPFSSHPLLQIGQRVRIRSGAMKGVEGVLVSRSGEQKLVITLDAIQRSLSLSIEGYDVEPV